MSQLAKAALIIIVMDLFLYAAFPQAQLGAGLVHELISSGSNGFQPGSTLNGVLHNTTAGESGITAGAMSFPDYVKKALALFVVIAGVFTAPFSVANYLYSLGVPTPVLMIYVGVVAAVYLLAVLDWLRSGA